MIRVLVVDDEALMRKGFQRTFDAARDIDVAVAVPGGQTLQAAREIRPDVVPLDMLDIRMRPWPTAAPYGRPRALGRSWTST